MCEPGFRVEVYDRNYGLFCSKEDCDSLLEEIGEEAYCEKFSDWRIRITQVHGGILFEGEEPRDGKFLDMPLEYTDHLVQSFEFAKQHKKIKNDIKYSNPSAETDMMAYMRAVSAGKQEKDEE